jgi:hypothetical protein
MGHLNEIPDWLWMILTLLSIATFFGSLIVLRMLIIRMPADYFAGRDPAPNRWADSHPAIRMTALVVKNLLGAVLVAFGLVMLFTPGQGILSILMGLSLLNVPGKRALERRIVGNPVVLRALNRVRARAGRQPLIVEQDA